MPYPQNQAGRHRSRESAFDQINRRRPEVERLLNEHHSLKQIQNHMLDIYNIRASPAQYKRAITYWKSRRVETRAQIRAREQVAKRSNNINNCSRQNETSLKSAHSRNGDGKIKKEPCVGPGIPEKIMDDIKKYPQTRRLEMTLEQWTKTSVMLITILLKGEFKDEILSQLRNIAHNAPAHS